LPKKQEGQTRYLTEDEICKLLDACAALRNPYLRTIVTVKEILGHGDFRMALRYAHLSLAHLRSAVEALDGLTPLPTTGNTAEMVANDTEMTHKMAHNTEIERP
jgi:hypothetical protein